MTRLLLWCICLLLPYQCLAQLTVDAGDCGGSKSCFRFPDGCSGSDCDMLVSWSVLQGQDKVEFELLGKTDGWVAVGLSEDKTMGEDSVMRCYNDGGNVFVGSSYNDASKGSISYLTQEGVSLSSGEYAGGVVKCKFTRDISSTNNKIFDLGKEYYLFLGVGPGPVTADKMTFHSSIPKITSSKVQITGECGGIKACFRFPDGCVGSSCDLLVSWRLLQGQDKVEFELLGKTDGWVAVGLSNDKGMGKDSVMRCYNDGGNVLVGSSYNDASKGSVTYLDQEGVSLSSGDYAGGLVSCKFTRDVTSTNDKIFNLEKEYYLLLGAGPVDAADATKMKFHSNIPKITSAKVKVTSSSGGGDIGAGEEENYPLVKAHGILMITAWTICVSTAIILARYFKKAWPGKLICDKQVWFSAHRFLNSLVLLLTIIAFVLIFVQVKGYTVGIDGPSTAHPILGIIVTAFAIINPLMALCRPAPDAPKRPIFNWAHWAVGSIAEILAIVAMYLGLSLSKAAAVSKPWTKYMLIGYIVVNVLFVLVLEAHKCYTDRQDSKKEREMEMNPVAGGAGAQQPKPAGLAFRYSVLGIYLLFAVIFYILMIVGIIIGR